MRFAPLAILIMLAITIGSKYSFDGYLTWYIFGGIIGYVILSGIFEIIKGGSK